MRRAGAAHVRTVSARPNTIVLRAEGPQRVSACVANACNQCFSAVGNRASWTVRPKSAIPDRSFVRSVALTCAYAEVSLGAPSRAPVLDESRQTLGAVSCGFLELACRDLSILGSPPATNGSRQPERSMYLGVCRALYQTSCREPSILGTTPQARGSRQRARRIYQLVRGTPSRQPCQSTSLSGTLPKTSGSRRPPEQHDQADDERRGGRARRADGGDEAAAPVPA